ncbi:thioredoxin family protein [Gramella sp. AN32]|uniref:Thioredoxin family protein n=1 Tax=Christiangramia antarctica TaxID=2058158 RepID=A0ABW5X6N3_9FLAO|nr:thioredoxin family protein [Gramella sp. AN32]MCM4154790.1 thiol reductase thioredoxin [Gramella sp. AN32]
MKRLFILIAAVGISCNSTKTTTSEPASSSTEAVSTKVNMDTKTKIETEVVKTSENHKIPKDMLLGKFHKEELKQAPFKSWFTPGYEDYTPSKEAMEVIKENINDYDITLLMGTWCGDSKRETPKFLKILDNAGYDYEKLQLIAVDRGKKTPLDIEEELEIIRVPTIVFFKNGKEVNRFVEYPQGNSIEDDIANIVSGENYKNSYAD